MTLFSSSIKAIADTTDYTHANFDNVVAAGDRRLPRVIIQLLAETEIPLPAKGQYIPISIVDSALVGKSIAERVRIKSMLGAAGLLALRS